jgi:S-DNA-T family DNA segregation ATPase FtsK/SpoIIIE
MEPCPECGFVTDAIDDASVPAALRTTTTVIADLLRREERAELLPIRPVPDVWSVLEYAGHLRDVFLVQRDRVLLALVVENPRFVPMNRNERVGLAGYNDDAPAVVADELVMAGDLLARVFERRTTDELARPCVYNFPEPTDRDVGWMGRHTVHEAIHHLMDVRSVLDRVQG